MQPYGSDRVRTVAGGRILLYSRYAKGWTARVAKTLTSSEHPGTAVFWDDAVYEVVSADAQPQGAVRYVLEVWRDEHAMRVTDRYDTESEAHRIAQHEAALRREKHRKTATLVGFLAGHLPAQVQEELGSELGVSPHRMTMLSVLMMFGIVAALIFSAVNKYMNNEPLHVWQVVLIGVFSIENGIRFHTAWSQSRPMGSMLGVLFYSIAYAAGWKRGMPSPMQEAKGNALYVRVEEEDTKLRDAFHVREPLVTLLSPAEQARFAERYDYDYRRHSTQVAVILLVFAAAGVYTSLDTLRTRGGAGPFLSFAFAAVIAFEQIIRLTAFKRGPAGSVLGLLARPLTKKLIA